MAIGEAAAVSSSPFTLYPLPPCRLLSVVRRAFAPFPLALPRHGSSLNALICTNRSRGLIPLRDSSNCPQTARKSHHLHASSFGAAGRKASASPCLIVTSTELSI